MMSARPTAASAAATPIEKITNRIPVSASGCSLKRQNAMKFRFAALSMSSMPMRTMMALRRVNAPARPMLNNIADKIKYPASGVMRGGRGESEKVGKGECSPAPFLSFSLSIWFGPSFGFPLVSHRDDDCANERGGQQQANHFERQHELVHQRCADLFDCRFGFRRDFAGRRDKTIFNRPSQRAEHGHGHNRAPNPRGR